MSKEDAINYIWAYHDGLNTTKNIYLRGYGQFACKQAIKEISDFPFCEDGSMIPDILYDLAKKYDKYSCMNSGTTAMYSCARDTITDIYDHIVAPTYENRRRAK